MGNLMRWAGGEGEQEHKINIQRLDMREGLLGQSLKDLSKWVENKK